MQCLRNGLNSPLRATFLCRKIDLLSPILIVIWILFAHTQRENRWFVSCFLGKLLDFSVTILAQSPKGQ